MENFFVVLGGMGTMATESFVHLLNECTPAHRDQEYLNYVVCNHATVPDRTAYILNESTEDPYPVLKSDIDAFSVMQPNFFVLTCNTAHYFYDRLQENTSVPILHMPRLAAQKVAQLAGDKSARVMILGTSGTISSKVYHKELERYPQLEVVVPDEYLQTEVMTLIYHDVKENDFINEERYYHILEVAANDYQCDYMILGCTELSLMQEKCPNHDYHVVDAQAELVDEVLKQMYK